MESRHPTLAVASLLLGVTLSGALAAVCQAQSVGMAVRHAAAEERSAPAPRLLLQESLAQAPLHSLPQASAGAGDQLAALQAWNAAHRLPVKNGFTRTLITPATVAEPARRLGSAVGELDRRMSHRARWLGALNDALKQKLRAERKPGLGGVGEDALRPCPDGCTDA